MSRWLASRKIRVRLTLWYALILGVVLVTFVAGVYVGLHKVLGDNLDESVNQQADAVAGVITLVDDRPVLPQAIVDAALDDAEDEVDPDDPDDLADEPFVRTWDADGRLVSNASALLPPSGSEERVRRALGGTEQWAVLGSGEDSLRVLVRPLRRNGEIVGAIEVGQSREDLVEAIDAYRDIAMLATPAALLLASAGGWFLARRALAPIDEMTRVARRISGEDLSARLDLQLPDDELGRLAATFDEMIARLDAAFRRQRRFTADASHELRTPLTALKGQVDVALVRERTPADYQLVLAKVNDEVDRLIRLVGSLLTLTRADAGEIALDREPVSLGDAVEGVAEQLLPLAVERGVTLDVERGPTTTVLADQSLLLQLLFNLGDNAIKYSPDGAHVTLGWEQSDGCATIVVRDTGIGIPPEHVPHIFDRFYRVDRARGRSDGSTGLGLAISSWIVSAHNGTIEVQSEPGEGSEFRVRLPLAPAF
jgi:heavy metal sensor kinase